MKPICNMQLNVLNDLAEAMKALDGKKATSSTLRTSQKRRECIRQGGLRWGEMQSLLKKNMY